MGGNLGSGEADMGERKPTARYVEREFYNTVRALLEQSSGSAVVRIVERLCKLGATAWSESTTFESDVSELNQSACSWSWQAALRTDPALPPVIVHPRISPVSDEAKVAWITLLQLREWFDATLTDRDFAFCRGCGLPFIQSQRGSKHCMIAKSCTDKSSKEGKKKTAAKKKSVKKKRASK